MRRTLWFFLPEALANSDVFEWFRCDSCRATFFLINKTVSVHERLQYLHDYEFLDIVEELCTSFNKDEYGVKQHEGKKYLFGPGIVDHLGPDKGFGQMGMGDYDARMQAYCRMFVENAGEDSILALLKKGNLDKEEMCRVECETSASGTTGPRARKTQVESKSKKASGRKLTFRMAFHSPKMKTAKCDSSDAVCRGKQSSLATRSILEQLDALNADDLRDIIIAATKKLHATKQ